MPLTEVQKRVLRLLARNRSPGSHLAGAAALHRDDASLRYSRDLDYFHDTEDLVAEAFGRDSALLRANGYRVTDAKSLPGFVRATVTDGAVEIRVEWARDSAFRFMPPIDDSEIGFVLHPVDAAVNKVLALAGREEPRDFLDTLFVHERILGLGALCWAAAGKDPGFSPSALVELLRAKGAITASELKTLDLAVALDAAELKRRWRGAIDAAMRFVEAMPASEAGCLYYDSVQRRFVQPVPGSREAGACTRHFGCLGGVIPQVPADGPVSADEAERQRLLQGFAPGPAPQTPP